MLIDTHAHMDFPEFDHDRDELFEQMRKSGIPSALIPAVSPKHWEHQIKIAKQYRCPYALGIHPWFVTDSIEIELRQLVDIIQQYKNDKSLVALGECGLDKMRSKNWNSQLIAFERQIELAMNTELPLIVHSVKSHNDVLSLLSKYKPEKGGLIHGFYGSLDIADKYLKLGFKLGIGGLLLNQDAKKLQNVVKQLPINSFVVETDSPSMLPRNRTEIRNTPLLINEIVTKIADLNRESTILVSEQLSASFCQVVDI